MASGMIAEDKKWRAEDDMRTLIEAEKIKNDKPRLKEAMKMVKEQRSALEKVTDNG